MKARSSPIPLDPEARDFLQTRDAKPRTQATYASALGAFQVFRGEQLKARRAGHAPALLSLRQLDIDVLLRFHAWMVAAGYDLSSRRTYIAAVVAFLMYALDQNLMSDKFSIDRARYQVRSLLKQGSYPTPPENEAVPRIIAYWDRMALPDDPKDALDVLRARAFVNLLYSTAGRISEVCALQRKQVQDGRKADVMVTGKGDKRRTVYILPEARAAIRKYLEARSDEHEPLFIRHHREYGRQATRQALWTIVKDAAQALGVDAHPHDFRHYRARQMLEQGAPLEAIQEILGHSDISTTRRVYAAYSKPTIRAIFEKATLSAAEALEREK